MACITLSITCVGNVLLQRHKLINTLIVVNFVPFAEQRRRKKANDG